MTTFPQPFPKIPTYRGQADLLHSVRRVVCMEKLDGANVRVGVPVTASSATDLLIGGRTLMEGEPGFNQAMLLPLIREEQALVESLIRITTQLGAPLTLYGEACGAPIQRMGHIYGAQLHFVLFAAKLGDVWLSPTQSARQEWPSLSWLASEANLTIAPSLYEGPADEEHFQSLLERASAHGLARGTQRPKEDMLHEGIVIWADPMLCGPDGAPLVAKLKHPSRREYNAPRDGEEVTPVSFASRCVTAERIDHARSYLQEKGRWDDANPDWQALARRVMQDVAREVDEYHTLLQKFGKDAVRDALQSQAMQLAPSL